MKISSRIFTYLPFGLASGVFALALVASPVALAQHGADDTTTSQTTTTTTTDGSQNRGSGSTSTVHTVAELETEHAAGDDSLQSAAKSLLETERQNHKVHSTAQRQQACKAHQAEINKRVNNYATAAQRHLGVFNSIFTKVQAFQTNKQLNVPNYDTLVATATDKQAAAQSAVDALKALDVNIDCTQADPANSVATVKTAVKNARTALQDYRSAIKDVTVALKGASTSTDDSTTGGDQ